MADHSNEPTATEERAAATQAGTNIPPATHHPTIDPTTGMAWEHDDRSPLDPGMPFDPLRKDPNDPNVST